jgi:hypothetical protein
MQKTTNDPATWLASLPDDVRPEMETLDAFIGQHMPGVPRTLWEGTFWGGTDQTIIGYGDLTMTQSRGRTVDWFMVGLARQRAHVSLYINAVRDGRYLTQQFAPRLGKVKVGAASIAIRRLSDLDMDALGKVIDIAYGQLADPPAARND